MRISLFRNAAARAAFALFVALFAVVPVAHAQNPQIASTDAPDGGDEITDTFFNANQFTVGASAFTVSTVTAQTTGGAAGNLPLAYLTSSVANMVGTRLTSNVNANTTVAPSGITVVTFDFNGTISLAANTSYFLVVGGNANAFLYLFGDETVNTGSNGNANGLVAFSFLNAETFLPPSAIAANLFAINGGVAPGGVVPEPSTIVGALAFAGMMGGLVVRKRIAR